MLILRVLQCATKNKQTVQSITGGSFLVLTLCTIYLLFKISLEEIPCHSDQLIKHAEYSVKCTDAKVAPIFEYREREYDEYNTILLTGNADTVHLISKIHRTAQEMQNRTKGYDIKIGKCSVSEMQKYFLVLEIEKNSRTVLYVKNRGWQANSDVFSIFCNRLHTEDRTGRDGAPLINLVFNKISLGLSEDDLESVLAILHNLHNLYSHSLGVYFYWVIAEKAVFLSSNVLLVFCVAIFLIFLEFITGGTFSLGLFQQKKGVYLLLMYECVFWDFALLSFFEVFFIYCVLVSLNFPLAILLGVFRIIFFFCEMIGCREYQENFFVNFCLLYENITASTTAKRVLPSALSNRPAKRKEAVRSEQKHSKKVELLGEA